MLCAWTSYGLFGMQMMFGFMLKDEKAFCIPA